MKNEKWEIRTQEAGFSFVELLITLVVFVFVIAAASNVFIALLTQFKQQSKIAETNLEGIIGLEILRRDIEHAGYGLPWVIPATVSYEEALVGYNDCAGAVPCNPPRAFVSGNDAGFNSSDELIVKAANIAPSNTAQRWTHQSTGDLKKVWDIPDENFVPGDYLVIISPGTAGSNRELVVNINNSADWYTTYNATADFAPLPPPVAEPEIHFVYGIDPDTDLRMPFNRADYYITDAAGTNVPDRCAVNTGVLFKNVISHIDGSRADNLPLLDCVADMQVVYQLDTTGDGTIDANTGDISALTDVDIRDELRAVRVYLLAHEGQRDSNFTYTANPVTVGEFGAGRAFDFTAVANPVPDWENYRWKVYTIVVIPTNLR